MSASDTSSAPPSTIMMASALPATMMSSSLYSSCWKVGFSTHCPWMRPMRTAAIGPSKGMRDSISDMLAPVMPSTSASFSWSAETTVTKTCVSLAKPSGKSGLSGRSTRRAERISLSLGRPSRLMKPPGNLPAA